MRRMTLIIMTSMMYGAIYGEEPSFSASLDAASAYDTKVYSMIGAGYEF